MRRNPENDLDDNVADVQGRPDCECASETGWRMGVS
jgi:hypothetical protein